MTTYPHCSHCCWDHHLHVEAHTTPCLMGCTGSKPVEQGALW